MGDQARQRHDCCGYQEERHDIAEQMEQAIARQSAHEEMPYEGPYDVDADVGDDHIADAVGIKQEHCGDQCNTECQRHPEIRGTLALADNQIDKDRREGNEAATDAEQLQQVG